MGKCEFGASDGLLGYFIYHVSAAWTSKMH